VLESVQRVHAFAGATATLFIPTLATSLWFLPCKELFTQPSHVTAILYVSKVGSTQLKFVTRIV
jgi:hypothetical protein